MRLGRASDVVTLIAVLSLMLSAGPVHALACLLAETSSAAPLPTEAPCHAPGHDEAPMPDDRPAPADDPGAGGPSMGCCLAPAGVMRAADRPAPSTAALPAALPARVSPVPAAAHPGPATHRPPAPPGPLHLIHGCFLT
jgi:hypothetical protein